VIRVGTVKSQATAFEPKADCLVLNGQPIKESWARKRLWKLDARVWVPTAVTALLQCRLAEIAEHSDELTLPLPTPLNDAFDAVLIHCRGLGRLGAEPFSLHFSLRD
jgi:hypothetical protein